MSSKNIANAIEIISTFLEKRYPVNLEHICNELGIKVKKDKPLGKDGYLVCQNGKKIILVNSLVTNRHRQNFIIAHELGHFLLHRDQLYSCDHISEAVNQNVNSQSQENEANEFASELLIPQWELVNHLPISAVTFSDIFHIADTFDVSVTHAAMKSVLASYAENEVLICYEGQKRKWFVSANRYTYASMIPTHCPVDLFLSKSKTDLSGVWDSLYHGSVHQEIFNPYGDQYLVLLSGNRSCRRW